MVSKKTLLRIKTSLQKKIKVNRFYLFGSRARGDFTKDSDYDFAIISQDFKKMSFDERQALTRTAVRKVLGVVSLDIACYTPQEYQAGKKSFLPSIIEREGVVV